MGLVETEKRELFNFASPFIYALGVVLDKNDRPNIIGLGWWSFVSGSPLMCVIAVAPERYSYECLEYHDEFTLNFPSVEQAKGAWLCGKKSGRGIDKFAETGFRQKVSKHVKVPMIENSSAAFECKIVNKVDTGDHRTYVGEILAQYVDVERKSHIYTVGYWDMLGFGADLNVIEKLGE
ncbi:MAG: flavin reductase family protein [bacterium]